MEIIKTSTIGIIIYKLENGKVSILVNNENNYYVDFYVNNNKQDNIYEIVAENMENKTNGKIKVEEIIKRINTKNIIKINENEIIMIRANEKEKCLDKEELSNEKNVSGWMTIDGIHDPVIKTRLGHKLRNKVFLSFLNNIKNDKFNKNMFKKN